MGGLEAGNGRVRTGHPKRIYPAQFQNLSSPARRGFHYCSGPNELSFKTVGRILSGLMIKYVSIMMEKAFCGIWIYGFAF
jgi:hypothetical protein